MKDMISCVVCCTCARMRFFRHYPAQVLVAADYIFGVCSSFILGVRIFLFKVEELGDSDDIVGGTLDHSGWSRPCKGGT